MLFPEEDQPGIDLILPDFDYIRDRLDDVEAVILTHGHEDHIGAVPHLLREREDIPIIASRLTLALIEAKLREYRIKPHTLEVREGQREQLGPFSVEFVAVNHSIPDALAVAITTGRAQSCTPVTSRWISCRWTAGSPTSTLWRAWATPAWIYCWSTRRTPRCRASSVPRATSSRCSNRFDETDGRIIVACFASHIHRVQQIINAAAAHGRKVAFIGRLMVRNMNVARDLGYLRIPGSTLVAADRIDEFPDDEVVLICTGRRANPWPCSAASRTGTTGSRSGPATRSCSRRR